MIRAFYRSWWRRPLWIVGLIILPLIAGRIALTPLLKTEIRRHLKGLEAQGEITFGDLDVFLFPPSFNFRDVVARGRAGEALEVERLEVHVASLRELWAPVPNLRLRMVRPQLRLQSSSPSGSQSGSQSGPNDLQQLARALPAARAEVTVVENGSITSLAGGSDRPIFDRISGDIEGIATGSEVRPQGWKMWADGRLLRTAPVHVIGESKPTGAWTTSVTVQETAAAAGQDGVPVAIDAKLRGVEGQARAQVHLSWPGEITTVVLAEDRIRGLSDSWPVPSKLVVTTSKRGQAPVGQTLDLVAVSSDETKSARGGFHAFDWIGLFIDVVRLSNEALMPPAPGMATLIEMEVDKTAAPDGDAR